MGLKVVNELRYFLLELSQNFLLAIERDSAHAGSTIEDCILSYKSDLFFTIQHYTFCSTINFHLTKFYKTAAYIS